MPVNFPDFVELFLIQSCYALEKIQASPAIAIHAREFPKQLWPDQSKRFCHNSELKTESWRIGSLPVHADQPYIERIMHSFEYLAYSSIFEATTYMNQVFCRIGSLTETADCDRSLIHFSESKPKLFGHVA